MTCVDLLSDTTYPQQAVRQLHQLLGNASEFPVESSQIYGLRQIARQQPDKVLDFARHQSERAEKLNHQAEVDFWTLVAKFCNRATSEWSVYNEGRTYLPEDIRDENIPQKQSGMSEKERSRINALRNRRDKWLDQWANEHIPAFFERFCTQCLYCKAMIEMSQSNRNSDTSTYQAQREAENSEAMQRAFTDARQRG